MIGHERLVSRQGVGWKAGRLKKRVSSPSVVLLWDLRRAAVIKKRDGGGRNLNKSRHAIAK
jgi:hypothetical protein